MENLMASGVTAEVRGSETTIRDSEKHNGGSELKVTVNHLNFHYGPRQVLFDVSVEVPNRKIIAPLDHPAAGSQPS